MVPRARACKFSSVMSRGRPVNNGASVRSSPAIAGSIGTMSYCTPSALAICAASSSDSFDVKRYGSITQRTRFAPSASTAITAVSAESTPPESPITTPENPLLLT